MGITLWAAGFSLLICEQPPPHSSVVWLYMHYKQRPPPLRTLYGYKQSKLWHPFLENDFSFSVRMHFFSLLGFINFDGSSCLFFDKNTFFHFQQRSKVSSIVFGKVVKMSDFYGLELISNGIKIDGFMYVLSNLPILTFFSILFVLLLFQKSDILRIFSKHWENCHPILFFRFPRKVKIYYCETLIYSSERSLETEEQCGLFFPCDLIVVIPLFLKKTRRLETRRANSWEPYLHLSFKAGCSRYIIISRRASSSLIFFALFWTEEVSARAQDFGKPF